MDEHLFRRAVFHGGVDPEIRGAAWKFLFGVFPFCSTPREREILKWEMDLNYEAMKARWKEEAARRGMGLVMDGVNDGWGEEEDGREDSKAHNTNHTSPSANPYSSSTDSNNTLAPELAQQVSFMRIQATLSAHRLFEMTDGPTFDDALKSIHKDVPRTDRETDFYGNSREGERNLVALRDALMTFAAYNKNIGYVQGMNDLLARFQR